MLQLHPTPAVKLPFSAEARYLACGNAENYFKTIMP